LFSANKEGALLVTQRDWVPPAIDTSVPSGARAYDYLLGGAHNFPADREMAIQVERAVPGARHVARINRAFLARAVRFMIGQGIRQLLDLGSGIPTVGNVHEIAQREAPECRVMYVDKDPIAFEHSQLLLTGNDRASAIQADIRNPQAILEDKETQRLLNFDEPVGLLLLLVLHWVPDSDDPHELMTHYRDALAPGSFLAISHMTNELEEKASTLAGTVNRSRSDQLSPRTRKEIAAFFGDFELIEPAVVPTGVWRPDGVGDITEDPDLAALSLAGIAHKL
jgi:SAM-dependent methyltransferase